MFLLTIWVLHGVFRVVVGRFTAQFPCSMVGTLGLFFGRDEMDVITESNLTELEL